MQALELRAFEEQAADFDRLVEKTTGLDGFCSSTDWGLPANAPAADGSVLGPYGEQVGDALEGNELGGVHEYDLSDCRAQPTHGAAS